MKVEDDPTIKRIRDVRHKISAQFGHDPKKLVDHYIELQKQYEDRLEKPIKRKSEPSEAVTK
jgi:hypothetical protein